MTRSNNNVSDVHRRSEHEPWAKGFLTKKTGAKEYHPYTRKDFWINNPIK